MGAPYYAPATLHSDWSEPFSPARHRCTTGKTDSQLFRGGSSRQTDRCHSERHKNGVTILPHESSCRDDCVCVSSVKVKLSLDRKSEARFWISFFEEERGSLISLCATCRKGVDAPQSCSPSRWCRRLWYFGGAASLWEGVLLLLFEGRWVWFDLNSGILG